MPNDPSSLRLNELMRQMGGEQPGSALRLSLEAEYQRRKFVWLRAAVVIAGVAVTAVCVSLLTNAMRPQPTATAALPVVKPAPAVAPAMSAAVTGPVAAPPPASAPTAVPFAAPQPAFTRELLKHEPEIGKLPTGASVLVDDGTCPPGQIKQVIGGSLSAGTPRMRACVARP